MNSEDLLQEGLERLESGEPVEDCLANMPPEEAELLRLTIALREIPSPVQGSRITADQRADLMIQAERAIQVTHDVKSSRRIQPRRPIRSWLRGRSAFDWVVAAGLTPAIALLIIGAVLTAITSPYAPSVVEVEREAAAVAEDVSSTTEDESASLAATSDVDTRAGEPVTVLKPTIKSGSAVSIEPPGYESYIPVMSNPLLRDAQTAIVDKVRGVVEVQASDGSWTAIRGTANMKSGQRLRTASLSSARLLFYDGSQATLGANSEISIDELNALRPEIGNRTVVVTQWLGKSDHEVAFRNDQGSLYEVKTPTGSGIARGTVFHVLVTPDLVTRFTVDEGAVSVTNADSTVLVLARQTTVYRPEDPPVSPTFTVTGEGEVTETGETWTIAGRQFAVTEETVFIGAPGVGDVVFVRGHVRMDGSLVADLIVLLRSSELNRFTIVGEVEEIDVDKWIVAGQTIAISETTDIDAEIGPGDMVRARGIVLEDGSLLARRIQLIDENVDGQPFEFNGVVQEIGDEIWLISGVDIATNDGTEIGPGIEIGNLVKVEGRILDDGVWLADEISLEEDDQAEFEFTGAVQSLDPWQVAGISVETDEESEIEEGIEVGDWVRVEGRILEDGTWHAEEIRLLGDDGLTTVVIIGMLDSVDPWSVSGFPFEVDDDTEIAPDLEAGDLVRVEAIILDDGTWLATEITLLDDDSDLGCLTITALVLGFSGDQLTIDGWPVIVIDDETGIDGDIEPGSIVIISMCLADDGTLVVVSITVLSSPILPTEQPGDGVVKLTLCHNVERNPHSITIAQPAVPAHLNHGDYLGACN